MQRGATAIIFDTTDHPEAATEVSYIYIWVKFNSFMFIWIKDSCILAYWQFSEIKQPNTKVTFEQQSHWLTCASLQQSCHCMRAAGEPSEHELIIYKNVLPTASAKKHNL